jgi:hypothetical protein
MCSLQTIASLKLEISVLLATWSRAAVEGLFVERQITWRQKLLCKKLNFKGTKNTVLKLTCGLLASSLTISLKDTLPLISAILTKIMKTF